jgi:4,4'-diaponeurosporenoate glycosyltransferase
VIIPARNEEDRIAPLLSSLVGQTLPPDEILVVDDESGDGTTTIAAEMGATVLTGQPVPRGWIGKPWACWQGAQQARGDLLVFLDADTRLAANGLARLVQSYRAGLLTVQPYHTIQKPYEALSAFFNIVLMAGLNAFTPLGQALKPSGAFGPCVVCRREDYVRLGGHHHPTVRGSVLESIPLARLYLAADLPVYCYGGWGAISFRMYPAGLGQLIEGWSKGFGSGALTTRWPFLLLIIAWITAGFNAFILPFQALLPPSGGPVVLTSLLYGLYALQVWWILRRIGNFGWWTALFFPLPLCFFALVMLRSFVLIHLRGRVHWRGRSVPTTRHEADR